LAFSGYFADTEKPNQSLFDQKSTYVFDAVHPYFKRTVAGAGMFMFSGAKILMSTGAGMFGSTVQE